jgi:putative flavoprotein involved in K+ transport
VGEGSDYDVVVIGAGQAGLALGYFLRQQNLRSVILEAGSGVGTAWRERWDSLTLFTPRRYDALPGLDFPGDPDGYPTRDEVLDYLGRYAETFQLPVEANSQVRSVAADNNRFLVEVDARQLRADNVVVTTGAFQHPRVPAFSKALVPEVFQTHSTSYRNPTQIPGEMVLVVGGGNTGFQIAEELAATHRVHLAIGSRQTPLPQRFLGRDLFWWLTKLGVLDKTVESRIGRRARDRDTLIGSSRRSIQRCGVTLKPRAVAARDRTVTFEDGRTLEVDAVIWATGFRPEYSWIDLPVTDEAGRVRHRRGVTDVPGLYFLGLSWQHTRGSALIGWVKDDAKFIADQIAARMHEREPALVAEGV